MFSRDYSKLLKNIYFDEQRRRAASFLYVSLRVLLSVFVSIFFVFFGRFSTILLVRHFLFLNVTNAKIFARSVIFVIVYFVTISLAIIFNISCRFPLINKRMEAALFSHTPFSFLVK